MSVAPTSGVVEPVFPPEATRVTGRRFAAHLVDGVVQLLIVVAAGVLGGIASAVLPVTAGNAVTAVLIVAALLFVAFGYFVVTQRRTGRSPGKALCGIRVVTADGAVPSTGALFKRTIPLLLEWFYLLAMIGMLSSPYRRRFGDRWGDTYVIADEWAPSSAGTVREPSATVSV